VTEIFGRELMEKPKTFRIHITCDSNIALEKNHPVQAFNISEDSPMDQYLNNLYQPEIMQTI
jgi:hypothetical protein